MKISALSKVLSHSLIGSLGIGIALCGLAPSAKAITVNRGTDYVATPPGGALFNFVDPLPNAGVVTVSFGGLPIGTPTATPPDGGSLGEADTVVNRLDDVDATPAGGQTALEIVGLSLRSVDPITLIPAPVNIGGTNYDVFAGLQKYYPVAEGGGTLSTGTMTIRDTGGSDGKTWDSEFTINGVAIVAPEGTLVPTGTDYVKGLIQGCPNANYICILFTKGPFIATNEPWTETPGSDTLLGDNLVEPGLAQNFYMTGTVIHDSGGGVIHGVQPTPVPIESDALPVVGSAVFMAGGIWWKRRRSQAKVADFVSESKSV